jgi:cation diffusion facilitator family transporter
MQEREKQIIRISWIGITGNSILSISKIVLGLVSGSLAVVGDGIDSAGDIITSWITLFTARIIARPPDYKFSYGYARAETIATSVLAFIIFFAGAQLCISTIEIISRGESTVLPSMLSIYVTLFSIGGKAFLSILHLRVGKKINSSMLIANGRNMQNDVIISVAVLIGLFFTFILKMPVMDKITALIISLWIMRVGLRIFLQTIIEMMDGVKDPAIYKKVFEALSEVSSAHNPHKVRIRQFGNLYLVSLDIEVDENITVKESHDIAIQVENNIKSKIDGVSEVLVHIEPSGNVEKEPYGVTKTHLDGDV